MSNQTLTVNHLQTLANAVLLAQKRGAFSLEEAGLLAEPVRLVRSVISQAAEQANNKETKDKNTSTALSPVPEDPEETDASEVKNV